MPFPSSPGQGAASAGAGDPAGEESPCLAALGRRLRQAREARNGQIVVARVDGGVTVKRLRQRGSTIELLPENPDFQPIVVDARTDDFALEGIGVGLVRSGKSL